MRDHKSLAQTAVHAALHQRATLSLALSVTSSLALILVLSFTACQEASLDCLSKSECDAETTCVAGRCVGVEVEGDPLELYANEMHPRLVSECGVCHAAAEESVMPPVGSDAEDQEHSIESDDPFGVPTYSATLGDSGWRIYIDNLTPERIRASYRDTLQYINKSDPAQSLLFAFGRGEMGVSRYLAHPKLYPTQEELDAPPENVEGADYVGYQRLITWAQLNHAPEDEMISYDLEFYQQEVSNVLGVCASCHDGDPTKSASSEKAQGGFAFNNNPESAQDLAPLSALINVEDPPQSALIRVSYGEFDHIEYPVNEQFIETVLAWIETLRL